MIPSYRDHLIRYYRRHLASDRDRCRDPELRQMRRAGMSLTRQQVRQRLVHLTGECNANATRDF